MAAIDLPNNRDLRVYLRELQVRGHTTEGDANEVIDRAGKLSAKEEGAILATLAALGDGVDETTAKHLGGYIEDEAAARKSHRQSGLLGTGIWSGIGALGGGVAGVGLYIGSGMLFAAAPVPTAIVWLATIFGVGSAMGCGTHAAGKAFDAVTYGLDE